MSLSRNPERALVAHKQRDHIRGQIWDARSADGGAADEAHADGRGVEGAMLLGARQRREWQDCAVGCGAGRCRRGLVLCNALDVIVLCKVGEMM